MTSFLRKLYHIRIINFLNMFGDVSFYSDGVTGGYSGDDIGGYSGDKGGYAGDQGCYSGGPQRAMQVILNLEMSGDVSGYSSEFVNRGDAQGRGDIGI